MTPHETIELLLDLTIDGDLPYEAREHLLRAANAVVCMNDGEPDFRWIQDSQDAFEEYRRAYDGKTPGKAEYREVMLPDELVQDERGVHQWALELVQRLARRERRRDDVMYEHCRRLMGTRPLNAE